MNEYEVGEIPPEQLEKQKKRPYLSEEDKAVADEAAKLMGKMAKDSYDRLRLEHAYLIGKVEVYERIIKKDSVEPKGEFGFSAEEKNDGK